MIRLFFITCNADSICTVNRLIKLVEKPTKLLALTSSYRFKLKSSVTMHKWLRKENFSIILIRLCLSSGSYQTTINWPLMTCNVHSPIEPGSQESEPLPEPDDGTASCFE